MDSEKIAVVDDEGALREAVVFALAKEGFSAVGYGDGHEAWSAFRDELPDLLILDIMMPRMDGRELLRLVRTKSREVPVIFLTSRDEEFDRVLGLELGADDYLTKPFSIRELIARVRAHLRRLRMLRDRSPLQPETVLRAGPLLLDTAGFRSTMNGVDVQFTVTEFRILEHLARSPGTVKTREQLLSAAYPEDIYLSDRTIDTHIKRIRAKLAARVEGFTPIETVHGAGYRFTAFSQEASPSPDSEERSAQPREGAVP